MSLLDKTGVNDFSCGVVPSLCLSKRDRSRPLSSELYSQMSPSVMGPPSSSHATNWGARLSPSHANIEVVLFLVADPRRRRTAPGRGPLVWIQALFSAPAMPVCLWSSSSSASVMRQGSEGTTWPTATPASIARQRYSADITLYRKNSFYSKSINCQADSFPALPCVL
jgi:hypothetical protein